MIKVGAWPDDEVYDITEAAAFIGVTVWAVRAWRLKGRGPEALRLGHRVYYRRSALLAWLATCPEAPRGAEFYKRRAA